MNGNRKMLKNKALKHALVLLALGVALLAAPAWSQEDAAAVNEVHIMKMPCKQLMGGNDVEREIGLAFYQGYLAAKRGAQTIDLPTASAWSDRVREYCLMNPSTSVMEAFKTTEE